jgi:two-component system sensor histidine kinase MtrB
VWWSRVTRRWGTSLALRTIAITVGLSTLAAAIVGATIAVSVGANLFDARRDQLLTLSQNATVQAQLIFDNAAESQTAELDTVLRNAAQVILSTAATTSGGTQFAIQVAPGQPVSGSQIPSKSRNLDVEAVVTPELAEAVSTEQEIRVWSQSAGVVREDGSIAPTLVTGSKLQVQGRDYVLFLVYDISDTAQTLAQIQGTLLGAGVALILLIGAVTWLVLRLVVGPIQVAADTSRKLAEGDLDVRLPVRGDDVIATLARSFNGMAESLRGQIVQLAALSTVQQRFVSDVSHELRTPLTTIRLAGDVLYDRRDEFPSDSVRTLELLHTQIERFETLLADLLEMSRYDAGAIEMEVEPVNLVRLIEDEIESFETLASTKGSVLQLVADGGWFEAEVDPRRIRRVVQNLLGNAIDHGEGRPISVWIDSDADAVAIAVRDHGVGIEPADLERVFDRFWRADPSRQRTTGGTGLGLAISLEDAALHGGWLQAWSAPGEGSCFRLTLPRRRGRSVTSSPLPLPPGSPDADHHERGDDHGHQ